MTPLSFDPLDFAAEFSTEMCPEGVVAVSGEKLRIFGVERLGEVFNQAALPLRSARELRSSRACAAPGLEGLCKRQYQGEACVGSFIGNHHDHGNDVTNGSKLVCGRPRLRLFARGRSWLQRRAVVDGSPL